MTLRNDKKSTRQRLREVVESHGIAWDAVTARVHADNAGMEIRDAESFVKSLREDKSAFVVVADAILSLLIDVGRGRMVLEHWRNADRCEAERQAHEATIKHYEKELQREQP